MVTLSLTVYGDGGTNMTDDMELSFMPMPMAAGTISGDDWVCKGGSNVYSTDEIGYAESYYWMLDPAEAGEITGDEMMVNIEWADDYIGMATLTVHGINLCGGGDFSEAFEIEVDDCTGIDDVNSASGISISPNPNSGSFTLNFNSIESSAIVKILNLTGKTVFETSSTNGSQVMVNVPDLENGIYFVEVKTGTTRNIEKLIINK
jgi:hypothetical protein